MHPGHHLCCLFAKLLEYRHLVHWYTFYRVDLPPVLLITSTRSTHNFDMATQTCSLCNTELLDNLIYCAGRCNKYYHYTCAGFSRNFFDGYKRVPGLKWQCSKCIDDFNGIWTKLEDLTTVVNEIKSLINLSGLIKSAIADTFNGDMPVERPTVTTAPMTQSDIHKKSKKKKKRQNKPPSKKDRIVESSQPTTNDKANVPFNFNVSDPINATLQPNASNDHLHSTVIEHSILTNQHQRTISQSQDYGIRVAEKRSYLWLGGFHHTSTVKQVQSLVSKILQIAESEVICRSLKSGRRQYNDFQHISFRIGLKSTDVKDAFEPNKWPEGVSCKYFNQKN